MVTDWYRTDLDQRRLAEFTQRTFAPHLGDHRDLLALFAQSGVAGLAGELLGDVSPVTTTQIQIRVPERDLGQAQPEKAMHVDGVACPHLDPADCRTFSLLVGVVLSDISDPAGGALRYVIGGHLRMAEWFRTQWSLGITAQVPPHIVAEQGTPLLGKPGDVLLMHHLVPHAVGRNLTAMPRIMAYFRVSHVNHANRRLAALRDPWLDFPPLAARVR
ncbi:phytanoyl-CoA dioxygenase family protein [Salinispora arenicola]|uniref:phytanoyl-CoA dioxygenase family protein n=1 Tax=Salinispora arenicola TaxID=168697 RepID=UPI0027DE210B|nr:phytanoyl-CoA dioxygenase family protein [Salinispora arenicola]